jgi:transcriptional regulator of acetoin/glycerol metabolism
MDRNRGNIANAARYSGKHRRAFWALLRKYDIEAEDFRT